MRQLFPETDGVVFPPIRTFRFEGNPQLSSLRRIVKEQMVKFKSETFLVARDHVIIGWKQKDVIRPISNLFGETNTVFDTNRNKFVTLSQEELTRLGVDPRLEVDTYMAFIRAADQAADAHSEIYRANHQANPHESDSAIHQATQRAHYEASQYAYIQAINQAKHQFDLEGNVLTCARGIQEIYNQAYQHYIGGGRN